MSRAKNIDRWGFPLTWTQIALRDKARQPPPLRRFRFKRSVRARLLLDKLIELQHVQQPGECLSCQRIAAACGISPEYVGQIEQRALKKLRNKFSAEEQKELAQYLKAYAQK